MKTILIATDFSVPANNAVRYGAQLAKQLDATIVLANAFSLPMGGYYSMAPLAVISELQSSSMEALHQLRTLKKVPLPCK